MHDEDITALASLVKNETRRVLSNIGLLDLVSLDWLQRFVLVLLKAVCEAVVEVWKEVLMSTAEELARQCPQCGRRRKWKWRRKQTMKLSVLGLNFELPKPYVECGHCDSPGVSMVKLLTGLRSGDSSTELELLAARRGAQDTYGKSAREMDAHHGQQIERTKLRRMALRVEQEAMGFAEDRRVRFEQAPLPLGGADKLLIEADGGSTRTGTLVPCEAGDEGYGKRTAKRGIARRKLAVQGREMITSNCRAPGEMKPRGLEVLMPALSPPGERARRMRTIAARAGMGSDTEMRGLGDMGSGLARAFDEAFPQSNSYWSADWHHLSEYVSAAQKVLVDFDAKRWGEQMRDIIWHRHKSMGEHLLCVAYGHLAPRQPEDAEKCPVDALQTYLTNNWKHVRSKQLRSEGLPFISARAENQVRERIRMRFGGPGTWREENLEPKATLLAIIDENSWDEFADYVRRRRDNDFRRHLVTRLSDAVNQGRLSPNALARAAALDNLPTEISDETMPICDLALAA